jgi:ribosomal protein S4E
MNNYRTIFHVGQRVVVTHGLFLGKTGTVVDYHPNANMGFIEDGTQRNYETCGFYVVRIGFRKRIYVIEQDLNAVVKR